MKIAIATYSVEPNLRETDKNLISIFRQNNIIAEPVVWSDKQIQWTDYEYVIIRTTWDYFLNIDEFQIWLDNLSQQNVKIINSYKTIKANLHKFYLKELQNKGVQIIPTIFIDKTEKLNIKTLKDELWDKNIIKPATSAGSYMTKPFSKDEIIQIQQEYSNIACKTDILIQPFMNEIVDFGEISMVFFNKKFSHSIQKTPKKGDFRVQSIYEGIYKPYYPSDELIKTAEFVLSCWDDKLMYARVDGVLSNDKFLLMELELIEPDLYFEFNENAQKKFVESFIEYTK